MKTNITSSLFTSSTSFDVVRFNLNVPSLDRRYSFYADLSFITDWASKPRKVRMSATTIDISSVLTLRIEDNNQVQFHFRFIESHANGLLSGYERRINMTEEDLQRIASGENVHLLVHADKTVIAPITFSEYAQQKIATLNPQQRRAFVKCLKTHFQWSNCTILVCSDLGKDFYFVEYIGERRGLRGGINYSTETVKLNGNRYDRCVYSVNT